MDIVLKQRIRHGAFSYAVSHDLHKMAISSDKDIAIYSIPDFCQLAVVPVRNTSSMVFLSDNISLLVLNSIGQMFHWNGEMLEDHGVWPVPQWYESPLFYGSDSKIFWGSQGGIWSYNVVQRSMKKILSIPKDVNICRCDHGVIKALLTESSSVDEQIIGLMEVSYEGEILSKRETKVPLKTRLINQPAWSNDDYIAVSTIAAPEQARPIFERIATYSFTPEGRAVLEQDFWLPENISCPHSILYLLDGTGDICIAKEFDADDNDGNLFCGNGILAQCCSGEENVVLMRMADLQEICNIPKSLLTKGIKVNPPTFVWFAPDNLLVVGSWERLFVFST